MDMQLEEGELSDSSEEGDINPYIPLERPLLHFEPVCNNGDENPAMDEEVTSSSQVQPPGLLDSDSETDADDNHSKRLKLSAPAKSKYNIWNKDPDGDLTDFLNQVGMDDKSAFDDHRNVENYPLPFKTSYKPNSNFQTKKRKLPKRRKCAQEPREDLKKLTRNLDLLEVNEDSAIEEVAEDITKKLQECNQELILRIVIVLGKDKAIQLYEKTRVIEKLGGMLIANGARKRTSGGVFIFLVRTDKDLSEDKLKAIFEKDLEQTKNIRKTMDKTRKKRKGKHLKRSKNKESPSELSNPPPSPNLPELSERKDVFTELASLDQQKEITGEMHRNEDDGLISYEDLDFPELV
ncbi:uncharacterized protein [Rhodnius prolixus]